MKKKMLLLLICFSTSIIYSQKFKFGKVSKEELAEKVYQNDSTANAAYLYKSRRTYYDFSNGIEIVTDVIQRIKIYKKDGFNAASLLIDYYKSSGSEEIVSSIKGYTFNLVNGKVEKVKLSKNSIFDEKISKTRHQKKITMPNVKVGSVIEIRYKLTSPFYQNIDELHFQYNIPVKRLAYNVSIPEYFVFNKKSKLKK